MGLAKNSFLYLFSNILIRATSFFLLPLYSYLVPPEVYGHIYVVSALSLFCGVFLPLSMSICISRFYFDCKNLEEIKRLYSTIVLFVFISSTTLILPLVVWKTIISEALNLPTNYYLVGLVMSFLNVYYQLILSLLYVMQKARQVSVTSAFVGVGHIVIQLFLVLNLEDKGVALLLTMFIQSLSTFIIFILYSKPYLALDFDFKSTAKYVKYSLSQFPSDISGWFVNFTDRILINKYISPASAGIYGIGANIGQVPMMIFLSVNSAFTPHINSQYKAMETANGVQLQEIKRNLSLTFMVVSSIMLMIVSILVVLSNNIVNMLSPAYADAFIVVIVVLVASLMNNYRCMFMAPLAYNIKYTKIKSAIWVLAGVLNIGLNFYLIPRYGIYAASMNSLVTYTMTFLLMLYYGKKAILVEYDWMILLKVLFVSVFFSLLLLLGNDMKWFVLKVMLIVPYTYLCFKYILKINIYNKICNYVKIFYNK